MNSTELQCFTCVYSYHLPRSVMVLTFNDRRLFMHSLFTEPSELFRWRHSKDVIFFNAFLILKCITHEIAPWAKHWRGNAKFLWFLVLAGDKVVCIHGYLIFVLFWPVLFETQVLWGKEKWKEPVLYCVKKAWHRLSKNILFFPDICKNAHS